MIIEITANNLHKAQQKAAALRPPVTRLDDSWYEVICASGHSHQVTFNIGTDGRIYGTCAPQLCRSRVACYHLVAAFERFRFDRIEPGMRVRVWSPSFSDCYPDRYYWATVRAVVEDNGHKAYVCDGFRVPVWHERIADVGWNVRAVQKRAA